MYLGVDTGGTFTDFVLYSELDGEQDLRVHKVLSTPEAPERAILQGIAELGIESGRLRIVHGSTVATNAVLEGKGARTAYIANRGLGDVLSIGRQARRELYHLQPPRLPPPVAPELCFETGGRLGADGAEVEALSGADLKALRSWLEQCAPQAVAINLLFSFLDDSAERAIADVVPEGIFVSRSSQVLPEYREVERGMATWLNAYVGPLVQGYLERLGESLAPAPVAVMQSSGDTVAAAQAGEAGVRLLLSGPAGGLSGARFIGQATGRRQLLTFDMGGTSTDVALIDGEIQLTSEGHLGAYPVAVPMVDMHTIGAGGGSLAAVDSAGMLQVGPESAGADPGPACYGRGGTRATVTDANLVLGRLRADAFLGGGMALDTAAARSVIARVAGQLGLSIEEAAFGVVRLADEHMVQALRVISIQRGIDPRGFTLASFGGAGGLHVCALARALGMNRALVPVHAGVLSALGMLVAPRGRQMSRTLTGLLSAIDPGAIERHFSELTADGTDALLREGLAAAELRAERAVDLRYQGQSFTLQLPWSGVTDTETAFHETHEARYGHRLDTAVELVNVRVALHGPLPDVRLPVLAAGGAARALQTVTVVGESEPVAVWDRAALGAGQIIDGPALITETVASTYVERGWCCEVDEVGNLLLSFQ